MDNQLIKIDGVELPEYIKFKRAPIWAINLGYTFAVIAGVNGIDGIHGIIMSLAGYLECSWVFRLIHVIDILMIVAILKWCFTYLFSKTTSNDKTCRGFYVHYKYDKCTRINGLCMLTLFIIIAAVRGDMLIWW